MESSTRADKQGAFERLCRDLAHIIREGFCYNRALARLTHETSFMNCTQEKQGVRDRRDSEDETSDPSRCSRKSRTNNEIRYTRNARSCSVATSRHESCG